MAENFLTSNSSKKVAHTDQRERFSYIKNSAGEMRKSSKLKTKYQIFASPMSKHSFVQLCNGKIFGFGINFYNALGDSKFAHEVNPIINSLEISSLNEFFNLFNASNTKKYNTIRRYFSKRNNMNQVTFDTIKYEKFLKFFRTRKIKHPLEVLESFHNKIKKIYLGENFTFILTNKYKQNVLYSIGKNDFGTLAIGNLTIQIRPIRVSFFNGINSKGGKIIDISCAKNHVVFLSSKGVFSCGINTNGALGIGKCYQKILSSPQKIKINVEIMKISSDLSNSYFLSKKNDIYFSGNGHNYKSKMKITYIPKRLIPHDYPQQKFRDFRSFPSHFFAFGVRNKLFGMGDNEECQIGRLVCKHVNELVLLPFSNSYDIKDIKGSKLNTIILYSNGMLCGMGNAIGLGMGLNFGGRFREGVLDETGLCDLKSTSNLRKMSRKRNCIDNNILENEKIVQIECGNLNTFVINDKGELFVAGDMSFDDKNSFRMGFKKVQIMRLKKVYLDNSIRQFMELLFVHLKDIKFCNINIQCV